MTLATWRKVQSWLLAYPTPERSRPLQPATAAANHGRFRHGWVDASYRTDLEPMQALDGLVHAPPGFLSGWRRRGRLDQAAPAQLHGTDGRFSIALSGQAEAGGGGVIAVGRVRAAPEGGSIVEVQLGRTGGVGMAVAVLAGLVPLAIVQFAVSVAAGEPNVFGPAIAAVMVALLVVTRRSVAEDGDVLVRLHDRVPPSAQQPVPPPACGPDEVVGGSEVRRALAAALARPTPVDITTALRPDEVRAAVRAELKASKRRRVIGSGSPMPLTGTVSARRIEVAVARQDGGESVTNPKLRGAIVRSAGGSTLHVTVGRSYQASWAMLALAVAGGIGAVGCLVGAALGGGGPWVGSALIIGLFAVGFASVVVASGWRADVAPSPLPSVVDAIDGHVVALAAPVPPPPLASPYRR